VAQGSDGREVERQRLARSIRLIRWAVAPIGKRPGKLPQRSRVVCNCADISEAQIKADLDGRRDAGDAAGKAEMRYLLRIVSARAAADGRQSGAAQRH
jgi:hypothetical protein